jgi:dihydrofolate reductase
MASVIYSMQVSLDGFINGPGGDIDWSAPDEELHRFHNEQTREAGAVLCGRRLYEAMTYWDTAEAESPSASPYEVEFARIWRQTPKVVVSRTLESLGPNARLVRDGVADELARLKEESAGPVVAGGAGLASALMELDLIDEFRRFIYPIVLGGGTPYFPALENRINLELVETRTFGSGVVCLRHRRPR